MKYLLCVMIVVCSWLQAIHAHPRNVVRDAGTQLSGGNNNEGEDHSPVQQPKGSTFTSAVVTPSGEQIAMFASKSSSNATQAFVIVHGKLRDGGHYWTVLNDVVQAAIAQNVAGVDSNAVIVAPQFFSARFNSGQYTANQLAWGDVNSWQAGDVAVHPVGSQTTSIDVLDSLVASLTNPSGYPNMRNITVLGHGGGGQLVQRYAAVGKDFANPAVHIRYIHADPSSCAYFTTDRPTISGTQLPSKASCALYNTWRYGFDNFTNSGAAQAVTPQDYYRQYISRDVISMVGYQDIKASGDDNCPAVMQGGLKRRDRNLIWWRYINTLGRTSENLDGFPGSFANLPDWSGQVASTGFKPKLIIIANATHSPTQVFNSPEGFSALFARSDAVEKGFRPGGSAATTSSGSGKSKTVSTSGSSTVSNDSSTTASEATRRPSAHISTLLVSITLIVLILFA